ncbi:MAG: hypothetical protein LWX11_03615 [Firmicutes bacterium]|nr:hypothetical protein [Bacillota bacterium]
MRPLVVRPAPEATQTQRSDLMVQALKTTGKPGDWLVRRGYHGTDHAISLVTGAAFSHAALLDVERGQVVEADGAGGVHVTPLETFAQASHRLWIVRPAWWTPERGAEAVAQARALVGRKYDFTGLSGLNDPNRYYCTELCLHVYREALPKGFHRPAVIAPGILYEWGTVLWDSGALLE